MIKTPISYLVLSDLHLGNTRVPASTIIDNLIFYFKDNSIVFKDLDILFIAGDLYDRLLHHGSHDSILISTWLSTVANFCAHNSIKLRILEGTPSHDWKQVKVFSKAISVVEHNCDFKYIESLSIEHIPDLGMDILYVPDEWRPDPADTLVEVKKLLMGDNLAKVDICVMHGQFEYQLPAVAKVPKHNEMEYLALTRYFIHIGHIHTHSSNKRIIAQGSFDRMAHNEEEAKGGVLVSLKEGRSEFRFIKNKKATIFKTVRIKEKALEQLLPRLDKIITKLPIDSHIRIRLSKNSPLISSIKDIKKRYPLYTITTDTKDVTVTNDVLINVVKGGSLRITDKNIAELLLSEIPGSLSKDELVIFNEELALVTSSIN